MVSPVFIVAIVFALVIAITIAWLVITYNRLVTLRNRIDNAWAQVEVQLQRRFDLIDNLVETVKGYAQHESETFQSVVQARNAARAGSGNDPRQMAEALTGIMPRVDALVEAYPALRANENYLALQSELAQTENKVSYMRQSVNDVTMRYNTAIQQFPTSIVAALFSFHKRDLFDAEAAAAAAPRVSF